MPRDVQSNCEYEGESRPCYWLYTMSLFGGKVSSVALNRRYPISSRPLKLLTRLPFETERSPLPFARQLPHSWAALSRSESPVDVSEMR